ncbi:hypothetical protein D3C73_928280 [compost metagenome]
MDTNDPLCPSFSIHRDRSWTDDDLFIAGKRSSQSCACLDGISTDCLFNTSRVVQKHVRHFRGVAADGLEFHYLFGCLSGG